MIGERVGLLVARLELSLLLFDELLARVVELRRFQQADHLQMLLDHVAEVEAASSPDVLDGIARPRAVMGDTLPVEPAVPTRSW